MVRMNEAQRAEWMGTAKQHQAITQKVEAGEFHCDECPSRAVAITYDGDDQVSVECYEHYRERLDAFRANRPSREELINRVNAAIGAA